MATSITATISSVTSVNGISSTSIQANTLTTVMALLIICGMLWLIIWRRVSMSLVYMDMMSPWAWVSKYLMGKASIFSNMSFRMFRRVPWPMLISTLDWVKDATTPRA